MSFRTDSSSAWHTLTDKAALAQLKSNAGGLTPEEVANRLQHYGPNKLPQAQPPSLLKRVFRQLNNLLIIVLIIAACITALMGHWLDFYVIMLVVVVNTVVGFVQEGKAERALNAIKHMLAPNATVLRNGQRSLIAADQLVPGDIVLLAAGDKIPADLRLLQTKNLHIQEAILTGESVAVEKNSETQKLTTELAERRCMAYSGTLITSGHAKALVVETGQRTEIGRISGLMTEVNELTTPLLQQMTRFSRWLTGIILMFAAMIYAYGTSIQGTSATEMFIIVVGLAVATIPEGLPAILTITLAIGVQRMAGQKAIIRRLPVVETLGAVSVICSDKTGTLTRNEMTVTSIVTGEDLIHVTGVGYAPDGEFYTAENVIEIENLPTVEWLLKAAALCNDASLSLVEAEWKTTGDPMEVALLTAAYKADFVVDDLHKHYPRQDVIPFDAEHRFMATLHHDHDGHDFIFVKGAPERLLADCQWQQDANGENKPLAITYWHQQLDKLAASGRRVLAVAMKPANAGQQELNFGDLKQDLVLLGLLGLMDPPREEAIIAIKAAHAAGIQVKMITGDHAATASAIAGQLALTNSEQVMTGNELNELDDETLRQKVETISVFARTSPEHKLRLVSALQANQHVVAMTGDGVNDAPALKRADVGIAMGRSGTEAAKEASEMVLMDDNFASIVRAVREGRTVYDNLKKAILFLLPINGGESLSIIVAVFAGLTLPITPIQILWVNMVSSVALAMVLAFEPSEEGSMQRQPRNRSEKILSGLLLWRITFVSLLFSIGIYGIYLWSQVQGASVEESRTYAVNTLVMMEVFYLFNVRCLHVASWSIRQWFTSKMAFISLGLVMLLQLAFTYLATMQQLFATEAISLFYWIVILGIGIALYLILEVEKAIRRALTGRNITQLSTSNG
ncbi:MAG: HAD-IC family P-type ATPase [Methylophaga sp.]|nr:HAD-IC family P-type ATPase [Methylophaga sp.]